MELHLINDLPLIGECTDVPALDAMVAETIREQAEALPAAVAWIDFSEFERLWARTAADDADLFVLIGTRPPKLWSRDPDRAATQRAVHVQTTRLHGVHGHTSSVRLHELPQFGEAGRICVLDDVLMSGSTVQAVLDAYDDDRKATVRVVIGTAAGLGRVAADVVSAQVVIEAEPIVEATAIFVSDLLYGDLRGRPFLSQTGLLRPYFGTDLEPWHRLRRDVDSSGLWSGPPE